MGPRLAQRLKEFAGEADLGKGALCVFLVVTDQAQNLGLPMDPSDLLTEGEGQVRGLGKAAVQKILARHDITQVLAKEGGRTSRKSVGNMRRYVRFLNRVDGEGNADLAAIERFWISRVKDFLAEKPLRLKLDANRSIRSIVSDLLRQAFERQKTAPGRTDAGALLQHLVGAKLEGALQKEIDHHGYSTADAPTARSGDFQVGDTVLHVTTAPAEAVISRCQENLDNGLRPILITLADKAKTATDLADNAGIADRFDILDIEQFLVLNIYEWAQFSTKNRQGTLGDLVVRYNRIVKEVETDPGLSIELG